MTDGNLNLTIIYYKIKQPYCCLALIYLLEVFIAGILSAAN